MHSHTRLISKTFLKEKKKHIRQKYNNHVNVSMQICFAAICVVLFFNMKKKAFYINARESESIHS